MIWDFVEESGFIEEHMEKIPTDGQGCSGKVFYNASTIVYGL